MFNILLINLSDLGSNQISNNMNFIITHFILLNVCTGDQHDIVELAQLLQLILGIAVNCQKAQGKNKILLFENTQLFKISFYFRSYY